MSTPIIELAALELAKRINDSNIPNINLIRPDREGKTYSQTDGTIVLRQGPSTKNELLSHEGNPPAIAFDCVFEVFVFIREVPEDEPAYIAACNRYATQIIYAITHPTDSPSTWYTLAGNVLDVRIGEHSPFISDKGSGGVMLPIRVIYRVSENDHTVAR